MARKLTHKWTSMSLPEPIKRELQLMGTFFNITHCRVIEDLLEHAGFYTHHNRHNIFVNLSNAERQKYKLFRENIPH